MLECRWIAGNASRTNSNSFGNLWSSKNRNAYPDDKIFLGGGKFQGAGDGAC